MTLWDCFEGYGNELECRNMTPNPLPRAPGLLGTDINWYDIVQEYTRRKITKDTDRLPALAGLAEQYRKTTGKRYLAGMWLEDMPVALLWHPRGKLRAPTTYCAPSWSWASLKGPVGFFDKSPEDWDNFTASVTAAYCEYYPPGTLSTVTSGWLDIKGPLTLVTGRRKEDPELGLLVNGEAVDGLASWSTRQDQSTLCTEEDVARSRIYLLKVVDRLRWKSSAALVLQKVEEQNGGKNTFRRLGYAVRTRRVSRSAWEDTTIRLI